jgi:hypothetical protein
MLIDYAYPTMMAEKALKELHEAMLMKRYEDAIDHALEAMDQLEDIVIAIEHDIELDKARQ